LKDSRWTEAVIDLGLGAASYERVWQKGDVEFAEEDERDSKGLL
jgi:hypothetical protein